jgi:probable phosphoglycerate mutase
MTNIYIARHGETVWNTERRMQGQFNSPLTALGIKQAGWLAQKVEGLAIDVIVTSPLERALDTARILRGTKEIEIIEESGFKEIYLGSWQGQSIEKVKEKYPKIHSNFWTKPEDYVPVDGESFIELTSRVEKAFNDVLVTYPNQNILIVAHAIVIKALLNIVQNGGNVNKLWEGERIKPTSLSLLKLEKGEVTVDYIGDVSHYLEVNEVGGWFVDKD